MKKSEIKKATNERLIMWLISTSRKDKVSESDEKTFVAVCEELKARGAISDYTDLYTCWRA